MIDRAHDLSRESMMFRFNERFRVPHVLPSVLFVRDREFQRFIILVRTVIADGRGSIER